MDRDNTSQSHSQTTYEDLPVEIWDTILSYLKPSNIVLIQNVCPLWFGIVQNYISNGRIKSDFYVSIQLN